MHYTINPLAPPTDSLYGEQRFIPGHDLGGGWTRHMVTLQKGDTAYNPGSTKRPVYGPGFIVYDVSPSGISGKEYNDAGQFYDDVFKTRIEMEIGPELRTLHDLLVAGDEESVNTVAHNILTKLDTNP